MKKSILVILLCVSVFIIADELQVPLDSQGKILTLEKEQEMKLRLFPEFDNFLSAEVYKDTSGMSLEIRYRQENEVYRQVRPIMDDEFLMLRESVDLNLFGDFAGPVHETDEGAGRKGMILSSTLMSLGYWGWGLPIALQVDDFKIGMGIYLLAGGGGFFLPFYLTRDVDIRRADARMFLYNATRGIAWGYFMGMSMMDPDSNMNYGENLMAFGVSLSLGGAFSGYALSRRFKIDDGHAENMSAWGDMGMVWSGLIAALIMENADDFDSARGYFSLVPIGGIGAYAGGLFYAKARDLSAGDAYLMRTGAMIGAQLGFLGIELSNGWDKVDTMTAYLLPLTALGFLSGDYFLRGDIHFKESEGFLTMLAQIAGSLVGAGVVYIADDGNFEPSAYLGASLLTGVTSSYFIWRTFRKKHLDEMDLGHLDIVPLKDGMMGVYTARF